MTSPHPLLPIIAHARSGALDQAWRMFREAGLEGVADDPAVLSVRGRLLKDRAARASGPERTQAWLDAAQAYAAAGAMGGGTYPLINAASLMWLAGAEGESRRLAGAVLARLDDGGEEAETPYWRAATRAEALLLLGRLGEALAALSAAIAEAPRAWEDHASTLRQFALVLGDMGEDRAWLDPLRPPRSLHFAGLMDGVGETQAAAVRQFISDERIGFGFGALAAGADIIVAEALIQAGASLDLVLPGPAPAFREASVAPAGADWAARFDRLLARADSVRCLSASGTPAGAPAVQAAAEIAMGAAAMNATTLASEAVQLLIVDDGAQSRSGAASERMAQTWRESGRRQHLLEVSGGRASRPAAPSSPQDQTLAAVLALETTGLEAALSHFAAAISSGPAPMLAPRWTESGLRLAFDRPGQAASAALALQAAAPAGAQARIGIHYGVVRRSADPFGGGDLLFGQAAALPSRIVASTPPGSINVSEDFAAALHAAQAGERPRIELIGELPGDEPDETIRLFSLQP